MSIYKAAGLGVVFVWFFVGGITHFLMADFFADIMPHYIPWHYPVVYVSGVLEILGAVGLLLPRWRQLAGSALFLLTMAVSPVNIHMLLNAEQFPEIPPILLTFRLIIQLLLLACIWWSTRTRSSINKAVTCYEAR